MKVFRTKTHEQVSNRHCPPRPRPRQNKKQFFYVYLMKDTAIIYPHVTTTDIHKNANVPYLEM